MYGRLISGCLLIASVFVNLATYVSARTPPFLVLVVLQLTAILLLIPICYRLAFAKFLWRRRPGESWLSQLYRQGELKTQLYRWLWNSIPERTRRNLVIAMFYTLASLGMTFTFSSVKSLSQIGDRYFVTERSGATREVTADEFQASSIPLARVFSSIWILLAAIALISYQIVIPKLETVMTERPTATIVFHRADDGGLPLPPAMTKGFPASVVVEKPNSPGSVEGTNSPTPLNHLGVRFFTTASDMAIGQPVEVEIEPMYPFDSDYGALRTGASFSIWENGNAIGNGTVGK